MKRTHQTPLGRWRDYVPLAVIFALFASVLVALPATAQDTPVCSSADADPDGDGWGWENDQSCQVATGTSTTPANTCDYSEAEQYGGWGWDPVNKVSCEPVDEPVETEEESATTSTPAASQTPDCVSIDDSDGDGWGWENGQSCRINPITVEFQENFQESRNDQATKPECADTNDPDGDGWGWENGRTCAHAPDAPTNLRITRRAGLNISDETELVWRAVDRAVGYIVYKDDNAIGTSTGNSYTIPFWGSTRASYSVRAYTAGKAAFSEHSQRLSTSGGTTVTECTVNGVDFNSGIRDFRVTNYYEFDNNGRDFFQIDLSIEADCDAKSHTVTLDDGLGGIQTFDISGIAEQLSIPSNYLRTDVAYEATTTSYFWDGSRVEGNQILFAVPSQRTVDDSPLLKRTIQSATGNVKGTHVLEMAILRRERNMENSERYVVTGLAVAGVAVTGIGLVTANPIVTVVGAVTVAAGVVLTGVSLVQTQLAIRASDIARAEFRDGVQQFLEERGHQRVDLYEYEHALIDMIIEAARDGEMNDAVMLDTISSYVESFIGGEAAEDWDGDGIPNGIDSTKGTRPSSTPTTPPDRGGCEDSGNCPVPPHDTPVTPDCGACPIVTPVPNWPPPPIVPIRTPKAAAPSEPICANSASDPDGDGWGWENGASCKVVSTAATPVTDENGNSYCASASSDPDGDGWGWENDASCVVR